MHYIINLMIKFIKIFLIAILISTNTFAGSDGELKLSKKNKPTKDCFEKINRATFALNQGLDKAIFKPVAKGYRTLPAPVKSSTSNVLNNLSNLITIPNNILQGDIKSAGINTGRLAVNTTIGILGIFDVATKIGFPKYIKEDYGQTFGKWGIGPGCYLVLPVLGPSTVRDTFGSFANVMGGDPYYNISINGNNEYLDGKLFAEQDRGARADALLRNELLSESFSILEDEYIEAWKSSPVRDEEGREKIFQMIQALRSVKQNLEEVAMTGKLASMQINETE